MKQQEQFTSKIAFIELRCAFDSKPTLYIKNTKKKTVKVFLE